MSKGIVIKSYLEDALSVAPTMGGCQPDSAVRGRPKAGGLTEFSGNYVADECQLGMFYPQTFFLTTNSPVFSMY